MNSLVQSTSAPTPTSSVSLHPVSSPWNFLPILHKVNKRLRRTKKFRPSRTFDIGMDGGGGNVSEKTIPTGPEHWEAQRRKWTQGFQQRKYDSSDSSSDEDDPFLEMIKYASFNKLGALYDEMVNEDKPFRRPIPLKYFIPILVAGWKITGLWPSQQALREQIIKRKLNPDDYDLDVHLASVLDSDEPRDRESLELDDSKALANGELLP